MAPMVRVARVYAVLDPDDGRRVLVDRLWPRGFRKDDPRVGHWLPAVAPSNDLRRWYSHQSARFAEFAARYEAELTLPEGKAALDELRELAAAGTVTLVTATRDLAESHAAVLRGLLA
ncbi:DUF488 domain-containing protein [Mycolicibacterium cosmeticum]|jgi:uncharacterized protein YeaO (DUF488 family)|uniref:Uroporphyrin-III C-methyltransferase n=2 Tax=Mycolicibacterium cosmeticum TaxID=258533 RepID=W9AXY3_MYCCO|nr:DUF488 family protein [Mycolicibacterium cosmeticum]TLH81480.1 DUF488 domain-containing protein [Mycolicibacterium cosmeticum]CDO10398.1 hypothetical protein BN977_05230 [Mycolicibacterium cosmeticum]